MSNCRFYKTTNVQQYTEPTNGPNRQIVELTHPIGLLFLVTIIPGILFNAGSPAAGTGLLLIGLEPKLIPHEN
jgi:hypothetical protein